MSSDFDINVGFKPNVDKAGESAVDALFSNTIPSGVQKSVRSLQDMRRAMEEVARASRGISAPGGGFGGSGGGGGGPPPVGGGLNADMPGGRRGGASSAMSNMQNTLGTIAQGQVLHLNYQQMQLESTQARVERAEIQRKLEHAQRIAGVGGTVMGALGVGFGMSQIAGGVQNAMQRDLATTQLLRQARQNPMGNDALVRNQLAVKNLSGFNQTQGVAMLQALTAGGLGANNLSAVAMAARLQGLQGTDIAGIVGAASGLGGLGGTVTQASNIGRLAAPGRQNEFMGAALGVTQASASGLAQPSLTQSASLVARFQKAGIASPTVAGQVASTMTGAFQDTNNTQLMQLLYSRMGQPGENFYDFQKRVAGMPSEEVFNAGMGTLQGIFGTSAIAQQQIARVTGTSLLTASKAQTAFAAGHQEVNIPGSGGIYGPPSPTAGLTPAEKTAQAQGAFGETMTNAMSAVEGFSGAVMAASGIIQHVYGGGGGPSGGAGSAFDSLMLAGTGAGLTIGAGRLMMGGARAIYKGGGFSGVAKSAVGRVTGTSATTAAEAAVLPGAEAVAGGSVATGAEVAGGAAAVSVLARLLPAISVLGRVVPVVSAVASTVDVVRGFHDSKSESDKRDAEIVAAMTAGGGAIGAGIGLAGFGVGAIPGAAIGMGVGNLAAHGVNWLRHSGDASSDTMGPNMGVSGGSAGSDVSIGTESINVETIQSLRINHLQIDNLKTPSGGNPSVGGFGGGVVPHVMAPMLSGPTGMNVGVTSGSGGSSDTNISAALSTDGPLGVIAQYKPGAFTDFIDRCEAWVEQQLKQFTGSTGTRYADPMARKGASDFHSFTGDASIPLGAIVTINPGGNKPGAVPSAGHAAVYLGGGQAAGVQDSGFGVINLDQWANQYGGGVAGWQPGIPGVSAANTASTSGISAQMAARSPSAVASGGKYGKYTQIFEAAGAKYGVPPEVLAAISFEENTNQDPNATSFDGRGARGLMQLEPNTWPGLGIMNPTDPTQNVMGGAKLFGGYLKKYGGNVDRAFSAYGQGDAGSQQGVSPGMQHAIDRMHGYLQQFTGRIDVFVHMPDGSIQQHATSMAPSGPYAGVQTSGRS